MPQDWSKETIDCSLNSSDDLLGELVTEEVTSQAWEWLYHFANRLGVARDEVEPSFVVAELVKAYAYREVCYRKGYHVGGEYYRGQGEGGTDYYALKGKMYTQRVAELEKSITASDLTGDSENKPTYRTVRLFRG